MVKETDILNTVKNIKGEDPLNNNDMLSRAPKKIQDAINNSSEKKSGIAVKACISYESISSNQRSKRFLQ